MKNGLIHNVERFVHVEYFVHLEQEEDSVECNKPSLSCFGSEFTGNITVYDAILNTSEVVSHGLRSAKFAKLNSWSYFYSYSHPGYLIFNPFLHEA